MLLFNPVPAKQPTALSYLNLSEKSLTTNKGPSIQRKFNPLIEKTTMKKTLLNSKHCSKESSCGFWGESVLLDSPWACDRWQITADLYQTCKERGEALVRTGRCVVGGGSLLWEAAECWVLAAGRHVHVRTAVITNHAVHCTSSPVQRCHQSALRRDSRIPIFRPNREKIYCSSLIISSFAPFGFFYTFSSRCFCQSCGSC